MYYVIEALISVASHGDPAATHERLDLVRVY